MLRIDLKIGQSITIGEGITITLEEKAGKTAKLAIAADKSIPIQRVQQGQTGPHVATMGLTGKP